MNTQDTYTLMQIHSYTAHNEEVLLVEFLAMLIQYFVVISIQSTFNFVSSLTDKISVNGTVTK